MAESSLVDYAMGGLKDKWTWANKHVDPYTPGVADLSAWVAGAGNVWIECKALERWPARSGTVVKFKRYTDEQRYFLLYRHGFLFVRIGREYLLFGWIAAHALCGREVRGVLESVALKQWKGSVDWNEFLEVIRNEKPNC